MVLAMARCLIHSALGNAWQCSAAQYAGDLERRKKKVGSKKKRLKIDAEKYVLISNLPQSVHSVVIKSQT